jgi:site-specific recombinase XerD
MGQLGRWLAVEGLETSQLSEARVEAFLADRPSGGRRPAPGKRSFRPLLEYLTDERAIGEEDVAPLTELDLLVARYQDWLVHERGLASTTVRRYLGLARRFLQECCSGGSRFTVEGLTGTQVVAFLRAECSRVSVGSAKGRVAELRSLLRFLYLESLTPMFLADSVPPVAGWHDTGLPASLSAEEVEAILASCDRSCPTGARDFAILTVLARLGLRSAEVARLELGDVDWRSGEIVVHGKGRRADRLPLPAEVGEALAAYLTDGRPKDDRRRLFLTCHAPLRPIQPDLCSDVVRRACRRAGLAPVGAHRLRHALATELLAKGADLVEISQVLRHRDLATTAIYAKVDMASLRQVAQPWPGAAR